MQDITQCRSCAQGGIQNGKQYDAVLPFIEGKRLDKWTHNKTIQKAVESYRITAEQKDYLKSLRVK